MNKDFVIEPFHCRVCRLDQVLEPWGEDGSSPTYCICGCCGVEFGYEDYSLISIHAFRKRWIDQGAKWFRLKDRPENWSLEEQLKEIPKEFR